MSIELEKHTVAQKSKRRRSAHRPGNPTADDIARAAGVSTATVSRALNTPDLVSPDLRLKVEQVVSALGYVPSGAARALASNKSFTIGAVIPTLNNAIFSACIAAFEERLSQSGYTLLVTVSNYDHANETQQVRKLLERGVDGMMLVGLDHADQTWQLIERSGLSVVTVWGYDADASIPCMGFDNAQAASLAIDHLVELGHRRIAMIGGIATGNDRAYHRRRGVRETLLKHGLEIDEQLFIEKPYSHADGRAGFAYLAQLPKPPTAIMCGNDVLAMGVIFEAQARGINVPDDLSVIGYDNLPITEHLKPALTTLDIPSRAMSIAAADALIANIRDGSTIESKKFTARFLLRETTKAPRS